MQQFLMLTIGAPLDLQDDDERTQAYMGEWGAWLGGLAASGALDSGRPLEVGGKDVQRDAITDLSAEDVGIGGYLIINAESLEEAARIALGSPHIALGERTIVRRCMNVS